MRKTNYYNLTRKINTMLTKFAGDLGDFHLSNEKDYIEIIFEENECLYQAFNCYNIALTDMLDKKFNEILPENLYYELENNCVARIYKQI